MMSAVRPILFDKKYEIRKFQTFDETRFLTYEQLKIFGCSTHALLRKQRRHNFLELY